MFLLVHTIFLTLLVFCAFVAFAQWRITKDTPILWYIGYLFFSVAHYGRNFWLNGNHQHYFEAPPNLPLRWDSPLSYAAFACYFLFIDNLMEISRYAPRLSWVMHRIAYFAGGMIGLHLMLQIFYGYDTANQLHVVFLIVLLPSMVLIIRHLLFHARSFYQKLVLVGAVALVIGYLCVWATRFIEDRSDIVTDAIRGFHTPWGTFYLYHLRVGIAIDVVCFSWALTLRQQRLLAAVSPPAVIQKVVVMPLSAAPEDNFLQKINDYLAESFHKETLTVGEVAQQAVHLSADVMTRKIKEKTGLTTEQYILRYRLERALEMLQVTDKPIGEISMAIGLKEVAHFSRAFKRQYGQTPSEIRLQLRKTDG